MANTLPPKLTLSVTGGEGLVTRMEKSYEFELKEKMERTFVINSSSETIDLTKVNSPTVFIFEGDGNFTVSFTVSGGDVIEFEVSQQIAMTLTSSFVSTLTALTITETASADRKISIRLYSEVVS